MVEKYLGKEAAEDIFAASFISGMVPEDQAMRVFDGMCKSAQHGGHGGGHGGGDGLSKLLGTVMSGAGKAISYIPPSMLWTAALGSGIGILGANAYDIIKELTSKEDAEEKHNLDLEEMYRLKEREAQDAKWMSDARRLRDRLKREGGKMSTKEYAEAYRKLVNVLNERRG